MQKKSKNIFTVLISLVIAFLLVFWISKSIDFKDVEKALREANFWYVGVSFILGGIAYWLRSQRWVLLLNSLQHNLSPTNAWASVSINYMMNLLIPRSGEVARCAAVYKSDDIPVNQSIGTVVVERIIDFICLFTVIGLTLILKYNLVVDLINQAFRARGNTMNDATNYGLWILIGVVVLFLLGFFIIKKFKLFDQIKEFTRGIREGISSIQKLKKRGLFLFYTVMIWVFYYLMTYLIIFAFEDSGHLNWTDGLFLLVAGGIGMVIPASGGIGSYHAAMKLAFISLGLGPTLGVSYALVMHTPHSLLALIFGVTGWIIISRKQKKKQSEPI